VPNYQVSLELDVDGEANPKRATLHPRETDYGGRVIGGDQGDLYFFGYTIHPGRTVLVDPYLATRHKDLTQDEVDDIAKSILMEAYESIGIEVCY
jgi:hypothetical protein